MGFRGFVLSAVGALLLSSGVPAASDFGSRADPVSRATTFAICETVAASGIADEVIDSGVEVVLRGYFKWANDPTDWSAISSAVERLHEAGIVVIGGFTASTFFLYEDGTTEEQYDDFVTRDAQGNIVVLWGESGAHYAINNPAVLDFLTERARLQVEAGLDGFHIDEPHIVGAPFWNLGNEGYDDYAIASFRDYLMWKYPDFSADDWKRFFDIDDIGTFDYRDYLAQHGWAKNPTLFYFLNPLASEWEPFLAWFDPLRIFTPDLVEIYSPDHFHGWAARKYVRSLVERIEEMEGEYQKPLYVCVNGISPYVDFQMNWIIAPFSFRWPLVDWILSQRRASRELLGRDVPIVFFVDWPPGMEWYAGLSEQQRRDHIRLASADTYAAGCFFAFHFYNGYQDFRTNGTRDVVLRLVDWFNSHADLYHGIEEHPKRLFVSTGDRIVAHALWSKPAEDLAILHLINHDYIEGFGIVQKSDFEVIVPIADVRRATLVSPDFEGELELSFRRDWNRTIILIPRLEFYDVVLIEFTPHGDDDADDDIDDDGGDEGEAGCGCG